MPHQPQYLLILVLLPALVAAIYDIIQRRIPNWLTLFIVLAFFPAAWISGFGLAEFGWHIAAGFLFLVIGIAFHALGLIGGGDAKLATGLALWIGWQGLFNFTIWMGLLGGLMALGYLMARWITKKPKTSLPYGVAIAGASFVMIIPHLTIN
jgi:prepilin peptidase CpaA